MTVLYTVQFCLVVLATSYFQLALLVFRLHWLWWYSFIDNNEG